MTKSLITWNENLFAPYLMKKEMIKKYSKYRYILSIIIILQGTRRILIHKTWIRQSSTYLSLRRLSAKIGPEAITEISKKERGNNKNCINLETFYNVRNHLNSTTTTRSISVLKGYVHLPKSTCVPNWYSKHTWLYFAVWLLFRKR